MGRNREGSSGGHVRTVQGRRRGPGNAQGRDGSTLQQRGVVFLYSAAVFFHGVQTGHHRPLALEGLVLKLCRAVSGVHVPSVTWVRRQLGTWPSSTSCCCAGRLGAWGVGLSD